jgi:hypothetical protein
MDPRRCRSVCGHQAVLPLPASPLPHAQGDHGRHHLTALSQTDRTPPNYDGRPGHQVDPELRLRILAH